jgi:dipeptidyl aminopeptidase/acylaminoacyl peptidase
MMHGIEDKAVPISQTREMVKMIESNRGAIKCIEFEGEGHGWRQAANIEAALEAELAWYKEHLLGIKLSS